MSRRTPFIVQAGLSALALMAAGPLLRADDPPAITPPPGYSVVYHDVGGRKVPVFVKDQFDPLRHANIGDDPLDHQKVFSETNAMAGKTFLPSSANVMDKVANGSQQTFDTKVYNTTGSNNVYNLGSKTTYHAGSYDGLKTAPGYEQSFTTKSASPEFQQAAAAFAPIGASEQNRTAPIDAKTYNTFASPEQDQKFAGPEEDARHKHLKNPTPIDGDMTIIDKIPDRPLSVDEVRGLLNHDFRPDLSQPAEPASKPLNDPNFQPEPLRIEPTSADDAPSAPPSGSRKVDDDDANDPVPSPGMMAEPLPSK